MVFEIQQQKKELRSSDTAWKISFCVEFSFSALQVLFNIFMPFDSVQLRRSSQNIYQSPLHLLLFFFLWLQKMALAF